MDLTYGGEYERFRNEVRDFIATHRGNAPDGQGMRAEKTRAWQKMLIERGYTARTIPREYGGFGGDADILKSRIIAEEFAHAQVPGGLGGQGISMLVPTLLEMGTEEQKRQFIGPTLRGETIWCQGYSEPGAGSDLASLRTRADLDGDEWVVNGQKIWTSTAQHADWIFCLVRTEPDAPKHQGISFLLFSMKTPGIEVRPLKTMTGDATFNEVFFTDVRVPKGQIVGRRGEGWLVANSILRHERSSLGDPNAMLTRLNALTELMKTETLDGRRLIDDPVFRDRLMKIQGDVMAMRLNDLRLLSAKLNNKNASLAGMIVKLKGTELRHDLESLGIDVLGEIGALYRDEQGDEHGDTPYLKDHGLYQYHYMFYLGLIIGGGTSQIQKNIISERGLGMPKEPKLSKEA